MGPTKKLVATGTDIFEKIRRSDAYYVDKTGFIAELLDNAKDGTVSLFTRPRRFGKTLMMTTLRAFLDPLTDQSIFDGLDITKRQDLCERYRGRTPTLFVTLKDVTGNSIGTAMSALKYTMWRTVCKYDFLQTSSALNDGDKRAIMSFYPESGNAADMPDDVAINGLATLSDLLCKHYGRDVVLIIDEYDVPLDYAYRGGYYAEMAQVVRSMFAPALKTSASLKMAALTGCLRISKESIFTGLNNFKVYGVSSAKYAQWFGFTDGEVREMLDYYDLSDKYETIRDWYDGYRFDDNLEMYCPWDVANYVRDLQDSPNKKPEAYWLGSSSNSILKDLVRDVGPEGRGKIESLISGETISQELRTEMTYGDIRENAGGDREVYLWSLMYASGYLTDASAPDGRLHELRVPNFEIQQIMRERVLEWVRDRACADEELVRRINGAVRSCDAGAFEEAFGAFLKGAMSIRDTASRDDLKENFYQGVLLPILRLNREWITQSQPESGEGYPDFVTWSDIEEAGVVIELKYAHDGDFKTALDAAERQIVGCDYATFFRDYTVTTLNALAVACYKKRCRARRVEVQISP